MNPLSEEEMREYERVTNAQPDFYVGFMYLALLRLFRDEKTPAMIADAVIEGFALNEILPDT